MAKAVVNSDQDVCPKCGQFVDGLIDPFGWCVNCALPIITGVKEGGNDGFCITCGNTVGDTTHKKCRQCRDVDWLTEHADEIDRCIANGASVYKARQLLRQHAKEQQRCLLCEGPMNKATRGTSYFCTKKSKCRTAQNRLRKLIYVKGFDRTDALQTVLEELKT